MGVCSACREVIAKSGICERLVNFVSRASLEFPTVPENGDAGAQGLVNGNVRASEGRLAVIFLIFRTC